MKSLASIFLIISLIPLAAIFATGMMIPNLQILQSELEGLNAQIEALKNELQIEKAAREAAQEQRDDLQAQLDQVSTELEATQQQLESSRDEVRSLKIQLEVAAQQINTERSEKSALVTALEQYKSNNAADGMPPSAETLPATSSRSLAVTGIIFPIILLGGILIGFLARYGLVRWMKTRRLNKRLQNFRKNRKEVANRTGQRRHPGAGYPQRAPGEQYPTQNYPTTDKSGKPGRRSRYNKQVSPIDEEDADMLPRKN